MNRGAILNRAGLLLAVALIVPACGGGSSSGGAAAPAGPGVTVALTSPAITSESGGTATFTVILNTTPTATVTIAVSSSDTNEGTVSTASLVFPAATVPVAQTVTVTGVDDGVVDALASTPYSIVLAAAVSTDANYSGVNPTDVNLTNADDDSVGISVTPTTLPDLTEGGGNQSFNVSLTSTPTADVSILLTVTGAGEVTINGFGSPGDVTSFTLVLTALQPSRDITVKPVDDGTVEGTEAFVITTGPSSSADGAYNALVIADVGGNVLDNDLAGLVVTPTTTSGGPTLVTSEFPTSDTFQVRLGSGVSLAGEVTVTITGTPIVAAAEGTTTTPSGNLTTTLVFNNANALTFQTVTVTGVNDGVDDVDVEYTLTLTASNTGLVVADNAYNSVAPANVFVTNIDTFGVTLPPGGTPGSTPTAAPGIPLGGAGDFNEFETTDPSVISNGLNGIDFEMFFRGRSKAGTKLDAIGMAVNNTSIPGPVTPEAGWTGFQEVLTGNSGINWVRRGVGRPSVLRGDLDQDPGDVTPHTYIMFYSGRFAGTYDGIDWSTSSDGVNWSPPQGAPRFAATGVAGDWDEDVVADPSVLLIGTTFHMWYTGVGGGLTQIGYATATLDPATGQPDVIGFVRQNLLAVPALTVGGANRFDTGGVSQPAVVFDGDTYKMWYTANDPVRGRTTIGYAQSDPVGLIPANPADFTAGRIPVPVIVPHATAVASWGDQNLFAPCALIKTAGAEYHVWYSGTGSGGMGIGYIEME